LVLWTLQFHKAIFKVNTVFFLLLPVLLKLSQKYSFNNRNYSFRYPMIISWKNPKVLNNQLIYFIFSSRSLSDLIYFFWPRLPVLAKKKKKPWQIASFQTITKFNSFLVQQRHSSQYLTDNWNETETEELKAFKVPFY